MNNEKTYTEKLRDPRWQKKRLDVMNRDGFKCTHCQAKDKTLNVHHRRYIAEIEPWEYNMEDLTTLCEDCHKLLSEESDAFIGSVRQWCLEHPRAARAIMSILFKSDKLQLITIYNMMKVITLKSTKVNG